MKNLKEIIKQNLTETDLRINERRTKILSMTCFWVRENFSAIIKHYGIKFYCHFDRSINDIVIERM
jgi:hypothetical protein